MRAPAAAESEHAAQALHTLGRRVARRRQRNASTAGGAPRVGAEVGGTATDRGAAQDTEDAILRVQVLDPGEDEGALIDSQRTAARLRGWSLYMGRAAASRWGGNSQGFRSASVEAPSLGEVACGSAIGLLPAWAQATYPLSVEACTEAEVITIAWNHVHSVLPSAALRGSLRAEVRWRDHDHRP